MPVMMIRAYELLVPKGGLEPPRVTSHAPQTCASTSSATSASLERFSKIRVPAHPATSSWAAANSSSPWKTVWASGPLLSATAEALGWMPAPPARQTVKPILCR